MIKKVSKPLKFPRIKDSSQKKINFNLLKNKIQQERGS